MLYAQGSDPLLRQDYYQGDLAINYGYALTAISVQDPAVANDLSPVESGNCVIRRKAATESGACRPPNPMEAVH
jgi:hypothetical protein